MQKVAISSPLFGSLKSENAFHKNICSSSVRSYGINYRVEFYWTVLYLEGFGLDEQTFQAGRGCCEMTDKILLIRSYLAALKTKLI